MTTTPREDDEFERMRLVAQIERDRLLITQYEEHQAFYVAGSRTAGTSLVGWIMSMVDPHIQALRDALVAEHAERIAEVQGWADEAAARGDLERQRWHLAHVERLKAMPYPWEHPAA